MRMLQFIACTVLSCVVWGAAMAQEVPVPATISNVDKAGAADAERPPDAGVPPGMTAAPEVPADIVADEGYDANDVEYYGGESDPAGVNGPEESTQENVLRNDEDVPRMEDEPSARSSEHDRDSTSQ